jgi:hypothetical protein
MNIDGVLEVLERELAIFEENQGQERPEETSADQAVVRTRLESAQCCEGKNPLNALCRSEIPSSRPAA